MARYRGAVCRLCRREGVRLYLKGERCFSGKCAIEKRAYPPGEQAQRRTRRRISDYGIQLREKQKLRRMYGVLERQFRSYFAQAARRSGVTGEALLQLLERRLDNVVWRLGFASSRPQARELVNHGHFAVNDRRVNIPSYRVRPGETIAVCDSSRSLPPIVAAVATAGGRRLPVWLQIGGDAMRGTVISLPARDEIDTQIQEELVVEYYSR
ncbi:MAG TPA: 30S ribosomal protein S4 [Armatimonadota bacterium]|nr:30S ribosomal protein S4 [Armatimonadota bacterium]